VYGSGYAEWNADLHYALPRGWSVTVGVFNLTNKKANSMEYYYIDRLPGEPAYGQAHTHFHPLEPFSGRLTIAKQF
jgi:outer membrane receptor protein involved in Fe transport